MNRGWPFSLKGFDFNFLKRNAPEKNRENFRILQSHNQLSARWLQKKAETSIYKNAEIGKASAVAAAASTVAEAAMAGQDGGTRCRDKSAVAAAMADRESRNVFKEFDHGFRRELRFKK
jgi:hypothetical protein